MIFISNFITRCQKLRKNSNSSRADPKRSRPTNAQKTSFNNNSDGRRKSELYGGQTLATTTYMKEIKGGDSKLISAYIERKKNVSRRRSILVKGAPRFLLLYNTMWTISARIQITKRIAVDNRSQGQCYENSETSRVQIHRYVILRRSRRIRTTNRHSIAEVCSDCASMYVLVFLWHRTNMQKQACHKEVVCYRGEATTK